MGKYDLDFASMFVYDETSPTFLRWTIPRKGRGGKPVSRRNNGQAGGLTDGGVAVFINGGLYSCKYIVWILFNGPVPDGRDVLFVDGNTQNLKISNLRLNHVLSQEEKYGEYLQDYFKYDETSPSCLRWKSRYAKGSTIRVGDVAGSLDDDDGYWRIHALGKFLKVHKVVWALFNDGKSQEGFTIDHINGNRGDNRITNLRLVENEINQRNRSKNKNNTTGVTGVAFGERFQNGEYYSKYTARVMYNGKPVQRSFSVQKYGDANALRLAKEWREEMIEQLNSQGAGYTDRHGTDNKVVDTPTQFP